MDIQFCTDTRGPTYIVIVDNTTLLNVGNIYVVSMCNMSMGETEVISDGGGGA